MHGYIYPMLRIFVLFTLVSFTACKSTQAPRQEHDTTIIYPIGKNGIWGYAAENGELIIDYQFDDAGCFNNNWATVRIGDKYGFIDRRGAIMVKPKFDNVLTKRSDHAFVEKNGKTFWVTKEGKKNKKYDRIIFHCGEPRMASNPFDYISKVDNYLCLNDEELSHQKRLDPTANFTSKDFTFSNVEAFSHGSFLVKKENKTGVFIHFNHVGLHPNWYDEIIPDFKSKSTPPTEGLYEATTAKVRLGSKWGLISSFGHFILEPEFLSIQYASGNFYLVEYKTNHWGYINTSNKRYF